MKKAILLLVALISLNLVVAVNAETDPHKTMGISLNSDDDPYKDCHNGGYGARECSIAAGVKLAGGGFSDGCSVSCVPGTYACCGLKCKCVIAVD